MCLPKGTNMPKLISILTLGPEIEAQQVLDTLPDLRGEVLAHVVIRALIPPFFASPNEPFQATRGFMFETTDEATVDDAAFISWQVFNLLVSNRHLGKMRSFQAVGIGVRRPDSGQGRGTVEILGEVKE